MNFHPIQIEDKFLFEQYYKDNTSMGSEVSFATPYTWAKSYNIAICESDNLLCLRGQTNKSPLYYLMPVGTGDKISLIRKLYALCQAENRPFMMQGIYKEDIELIKAALPDVPLSYHASRDASEYIYEASSLVSLAGKKLHAKRNHVNAFKKTYAYHTEKINDKNVADAASFVFARCNSDEETVAMKRFFDAYFSLDVIGMLLYVDNQIVAVTAGEFLNPETALIHLEKASTDYTGSYAAVNQLFIEKYFVSATYVNREEDMGIEGLRRAKMSYRPAFLLDKYMVWEG